MMKMVKENSSQSKTEKKEENEKPLEEIAYNMNLETQFDKIKNDLWFNEELQMQPIKKRKAIFRYIKKTLFGLQ